MGLESVAPSAARLSTSAPARRALAACARPREVSRPRAYWVREDRDRRQRRAAEVEQHPVVARGVDAAIERARERLAEAIAGLAQRGVTARGEVGDAEPLHAIDDALVSFPAEEIIIGTHPPGESHWLEKGLIEGAHERYPMTVTHIQSNYGLLSEAAIP